jgi:hypothetical protein
LRRERIAACIDSRTANEFDLVLKGMSVTLSNFFEYTMCSGGDLRPNAVARQ